MSVLTLAVLGVGGGALLVATAVLVPGRLLSRPETDALPNGDPAASEEAGA